MSVWKGQGLMVLSVALIPLAVNQVASDVASQTKCRPHYSIAELPQPKDLGVALRETLKQCATSHDRIKLGILPQTASMAQW